MLLRVNILIYITQNPIANIIIKSNCEIVHIEHSLYAQYVSLSHFMSEILCLVGRASSGRANGSTGEHGVSENWRVVFR